MDSTLVRILLVCLVVLFIGMVATIVLLADAIPESVPVENVFVDVDGDGQDDVVLDGKVIFNKNSGEQNFIQSMEK